MFVFEAYDTRDVSADGSLEACGAMWTQERLWVSKPLEGLVIILGLGILAAVAGAFILDDHRSNFWLAASALLGVASIAVWNLGKSLCAADCALTFLADGGMETPFGQPYGPRTWKIEGHHADIVSIQAQQGTVFQGMDALCSFEVCLYTTDGSIICLANGLRQWQAHKIAVLLTNALAEMQGSLATLSRRRTEPASAQAKHRSPAYID